MSKGTFSPPSKIKWNLVSKVGLPPQELCVTESQAPRQFLCQGSYSLFTAWMFDDFSGFDVPGDDPVEAWAIIEGFCSDYAMNTVIEKAEALYRSLVGCKDDAEKMYEIMNLAGCDRGLLSEQQLRIEQAKMALANFEPLINPGLASQGAGAGDGGDPTRATWTKIGQSGDQASAPPVPAGLVLSKGETEVFAARLRRLCNFVGYEAPSHQDDILVSVGPTIIAECLRFLATRKLRCGDVRAQLEGILSSLTDVSEFSVENARKQIQTMLEQITERVDLV